MESEAADAGKGHSDGWRSIFIQEDGEGAQAEEQDQSRAAGPRAQTEVNEGGGAGFIFRDSG